MKHKKNNSSIKTGLIISIFLSLLIMTLLIIVAGFKGSISSFELLALSMSLLAITLTIIQSFSIHSQTVETRKSTMEVSRADRDIVRLVKEEQAQNSLLDEDIELDKILVKILSEHGIEIDHHSAKSIRQKIKKHRLIR